MHWREIAIIILSGFWNWGIARTLRVPGASIAGLKNLAAVLSLAEQDSFVSVGSSESSLETT
ncbi:MAG: hypothetical protein OXC26_20445 [Albidovulum sp.]|nr:hypothetical protein [Albidovulum sp.]